MDKKTWDETYDYEKDPKKRSLVYPLSGWKFYINGESENDAQFLRKIFAETIKKYGLGWKSSKKKFFELSRGTRKENVAFFLYLPSKIIGEKEKISKELSDILIKNNYQKDFPVGKGEKITKSIYCRYELSIPPREEGFNRGEYKKYRSSN